MNNIDIVRLAFKNFMRRKVRTFLTILGVLIGTSSIVIMLSLGIGMNESFKKEVMRMGSLNVINVDPYYVPEGPEARNYMPTKPVKIDDKIIEQIERIKGVEAVTPILQVSMKFVSGKHVAYVNLIGIKPEVMKNFDFIVSEGRLLTNADTNGVVFGYTVPMQFYNPKRGYFYFGGEGQQKPPVDVLTAKLQATFDMSYGERRVPGMGAQANKQPKLYKIDGVGVLQQSNNEKDYSAYINIETLKKFIKENSKSSGGKGARMDYYVPDLSNGYQQVMVKVKDIKDVERVQNEIKKMKLGARSLGDILRGMQKTARTLQLILGGIGAIALLVAALGITNTMVMSIYERTREIGIMKVLGCLVKDIKKLFLLESALIGFFGGICGMLFSLLASFILNKVAVNMMGGMQYMMYIPGGEQNQISIIPLWLSLASVAFATFVGIVSGYYPARRATKLSALEAIRTE